MSQHVLLVLIALASSDGSEESAYSQRLARAVAAPIHEGYVDNDPTECVMMAV